MSLNKKKKNIDDLVLEKEALIKAKENSKGKHDELENCKVNIQALNKDVAEKFKQIEALKEENTKKQQAIVVMREKIRDKKEPDSRETQKLNFELKARDNELEHLRDKIGNLNNAYEQKAKEYDLSVKQIQNLQSEITNLKILVHNKNEVLLPKEPITAAQDKAVVNDFPDWWKTHMFKI